MLPTCPLTLPTPQPTGPSLATANFLTHPDLSHTSGFNLEILCPLYTEGTSDDFFILQKEWIFCLKQKPKLKVMLSHVVFKCFYFI